MYFGAIFGMGTPELVLLIIAVLLLFGSSRLPELFRSAGKAVHELRKGLNGDEADSKKASKPESASAKDQA